ncbi:MAG: CsbD family protein, partial [Oscillochloris sp.]|nr:CsbD family protein [Oscillochloris sp.]
AKGIGEEIAGKGEGAVGSLIGNEQMQAEGKAKELKGKGRQKANR